jgi:hypothetical protein
VGEEVGAKGQRLQVPRKAAASTADALGDGVELAAVVAVERDDLVSVPKAALAQDDGLDLVDARPWH